LTLAEIKGVSGQAGNFEVQVIQYPRYVDMDKCIACGICAEKCPKKIANAYDENLIKRKAIYVKYAQAVPLKYVIDEESCIYFSKGRCKACEKFCPSGAIDFEDKQKDLSIKVGAIVLAGGCEVYDPGQHDVYGYKKSPNIVTSLEFERILAATGPFGGHLIKPSDHKEPQKIAWLQCIGSRDTHPGSRSYCSGVCCTQAIKEAIIAKEHRKGDLDTTIFYIDIRTHGKDFEKYYNRAVDAGVRFVKSKTSAVAPDKDTGDVFVRYIDETGRSVEEAFDIVVLSVGFQTAYDTAVLAQKIGVALDRYQHARTDSFDPVNTSKPGIFACGTFEGPKDIPQSVVESSASAAAVASSLTEARGSMTRIKQIPAEIDVRGETPRIGVFVCCCGTNIAGFVDVPAVVEYAQTLPHVVFAEQNLFSCSQDTQKQITEVIKAQKLNRIVVSACTPRTHEPLFQETVLNAGINKYLFEMANIRNQCSWVHSDDMPAATQKAQDLVRMAVSRVSLLQPLQDPKIPVNKAALVVGGGFSGITAAKNLAQQGFHVYLLERQKALGGQALNLHETWPGEDIQTKLAGLIKSVASDQNIDILTDTDLKTVEGFVGNFHSTIETSGQERVIDYGVAIIATGAEELKPDQHLYGKDPNVLTGLELDRKFIDHDASLKEFNAVLFLQCVGSRIAERPYCSRVCCTHSVKNAIKLKQIKPEMEVFIVYRDMRTYGLRENLYREARAQGVVFIRYDFSQELEVSQDGRHLRVRFTNSALKREMEICPDLIVLASAVVPPRENPISQLFKLPVNEDGFFVEAHAKLRPVEFTTEGVFMAGLAHYPKPVDESIAQATAAASRAAVVLSKDEITAEGAVAHVNEMLCRGCGDCAEACPYSAIELVEHEAQKKVARVQEALCKGCGACTAACPTGADTIYHYDDQTMLNIVEAALEAL